MKWDISALTALPHTLTGVLLLMYFSKPDFNDFFHGPNTDMKVATKSTIPIKIPINITHIEMIARLLKKNNST